LQDVKSTKMNITLIMLKKFIGITIISFAVIVVNANVAYSSEKNVWVRGPAVIVKGSYELIREPGICGGDGGVDIRELTEGSYSSYRFQYYEICPGYYNMVSNISFDSPHEKIEAGSTVYVKANGTKSGKQNCCFLFDYFKYSSSCASLVPSGEEVFLNLGLLPLTEFVIPESGEPTRGYNGSVEDVIDIAMTMPTYGTECIVSGYANDGLSLKWIYKMETEKLSDVIITSLTPDGSEYKCDSDVVNDFTITLSNTGSTEDTGTINLSATDLAGATFLDSSFSYSVAANSQKDYHFGMTFPFSMINSNGHVRATLSSNIGINDSTKSIDVSVNCKGVDPNVVTTMIMYILLGGDFGE
jgi:hypothetical protein